jgi:hypothetical protein
VASNLFSVFSLLAIGIAAGGNDATAGFIAMSDIIDPMLSDLDNLGIPATPAAPLTVHTDLSIWSIPNQMGKRRYWDWISSGPLLAWHCVTMELEPIGSGSGLLTEDIVFRIDQLLAIDDSLS